MYVHFTSATALNAIPMAAKKVRIQVNTGFTGTLTLSDETGTTGSPVIGVITNPAAGQYYEYWTIQTGFTITPSTTGIDLTVLADFSRAGTAQ